jgi:hypothetical protein
MPLLLSRWHKFLERDLDGDPCENQPLAQLRLQNETLVVALNVARSVHTPQLELAGYLPEGLALREVWSDAVVTGAGGMLRVLNCRLDLVQYGWLRKWRVDGGPGR